jgi:hypothetical protein
MKERPIIVSGESVRAILAGRKTVTRRVVKPQPDAERVVHAGGTICEFVPVKNGRSGAFAIRCPQGEPGDLLWVRETWGYRGGCYTIGDSHERVTLHYAADDSRRDFTRPVGIMARLGASQAKGKPDASLEPDAYAKHLERWWRSWRTPLYMPRWASRLTLRVESVRVERLRDITEEDARAEGVEPCPSCTSCDPGDTSTPSHVCAFADGWNALHGWNKPKGWIANPWVWRTAFSRVTP